MSANLDLNGDGSVVVFASRASDLVTAPDQDTNDAVDIFTAAFDLTTAQRSHIRVVSRRPDTPMVEGNGDSTFPSIDSTGAVIAFGTVADNLIPGDSNGVSDVAVNDGTAILRGSGIVQGNAPSAVPALSDDGTHVEYFSSASNLVPGDVVANQEVFVTDFAGTGLMVRSAVRASRVCTAGTPVPTHWRSTLTELASHSGAGIRSSCPATRTDDSMCSFMMCPRVSPSV